MLAASEGFLLASEMVTDTTVLSSDAEPEPEPEPCDVDGTLFGYVKWVSNSKLHVSVHVVDFASNSHLQTADNALHFNLEFGDGSAEAFVSSNLDLVTLMNTVNGGLPQVAILFTTDNLATLDKVEVAIGSTGNLCDLTNACGWQELSLLSTFSEDLPSLQFEECVSQSSPYYSSCDFQNNIKAVLTGNDIELSLMAPSDLNTVANTAASEGVSNIDLQLFGYSADYSHSRQATVELYNEQWQNFSYDWEGVLADWGDMRYLWIDTKLHTSAGDQYECQNETVLDLQNVEPLCRVLDLLDYHYENGQLVLDFLDPNDPLYFENAVQNIGWTKSDVDSVILNATTKIETQLQYTRADGTFGSTSYTVLPSSFSSAEDLQLLYSIADTVGLEGHVSIELTTIDGSTYSCYYSPITFLQDIPANGGDLPDYECGATYQPPTGTSSTPAETVKEGDVISMNGLYFRVSTVASYAGGVLNGVGHLKVPFKDQLVQVSISNASINEDMVATAGQIASVSNNPGFAASMNASYPPLNFGGEICVESPEEGYDDSGINSVTGLNDRGFGADSLHNLTGTRYDPNGFDINGDHADTDGSYDPNGCDMYGNDASGNPCVTNEDIQVVADFVNKELETIDQKTTDAINDIVATLQASIDSLDCTALRQSLDDKIQATGLEPSYIIGADARYMNEGMSSLFTSEPKLPVLNGRDPAVVEVEKAHIELYKCDKAAVELSSLLAMVSTVDTAMLNADIRYELSQLTKYQVDQFSADPSKFQEWLIHVIVKLLEQYNDLASVDKTSGGESGTAVGAAIMPMASNMALRRAVAEQLIDIRDFIAPSSGQSQDVFGHSFQDY